MSERYLKPVQLPFKLENPVKSFLCGLYDIRLGAISVTTLSFVIKLILSIRAGLILSNINSSTTALSIALEVYIMIIMAVSTVGLVAIYLRIPILSEIYVYFFSIFETIMGFCWVVSYGALDTIQRNEEWEYCTTDEELYLQQAEFCKQAVKQKAVWTKAILFCGIMVWFFHIYCAFVMWGYKTRCQREKRELERRKAEEELRRLKRLSRMKSRRSTISVSIV